MSSLIEEDTTLFPKKSRYIKTDKPRPFRCHICTRGFVRQEHLKRHIVSHTKERPYLCVLCGRCFARKDLVLRHQNKLHPTFNNQSNINNIDINNTLDNSLQNDLHQLNPNLKKDNIENGILKIVGNTETILPIGSGKDTKRKKLSRKGKQKLSPNLKFFDNSTIDNITSDSYKNRKLRRNHSFSALNAHSYTKSGKIESDHISSSIQQLSDGPTKILTTNTNSKNVNGTSNKTTITTINSSVSENVVSSDLTPSSNLQPRGESQSNMEIPSENISNEIEFSTVHLNSQQQLHRLEQNGMLDPELSSIFSLNMTHMNSEAPQPFVYNNHINGNVNYMYNIDLNHNTIVSINDGIQPSYSNTMDASLVDPTLSESVTQDVPIRMNINTFEHQPNDLNDSYPQVPYSEIWLMTDPNMKTSATNFATINFKDNISNVNASSTSISNTITTTTNISDNDSSFEDPWINKLVADFSAMNYKIDPKNFDNIGFYTSLPSSFASSSISSCSCTSSASSINKKRITPKTLPSKLDNGISTYFTLRQLDISRAQKDLLISQQKGINMHSKPCKSTIIPNSVSINYDNNVNQIVNSGKSNNFTINFATERTSEVVTASSSVDNLTQTSNNLSLNNSSQHPTNPNVIPTLSGTDLDGSNYTLFDDELRNFIIHENKLSDNSFPTVNQLNDYINLYKLEFGVYVSFIHFPSINPSQENYPLLTAIAMIGALYSYRSSHTKILSNVTMAQLTRHLQALQNGTQYQHDCAGNPLIPIWILQTMTLVNFLGVFNNNGKVIREINTNMMSLINLILKYNINLPLEQFMDPPEILFPPTEEQITAMFQYFIHAQERIRLCHMLLLLSNAFASLVGLQCGFHSTDLKCGVPTIYEDLFECNNPTQWYELLQKSSIVINSKSLLIQLSKGNELYENCLSYLINGDPFFLQKAKLSKLTMFSLLVSIHEKISMERSDCISQVLMNTNGNGEMMDSKLILPKIDQRWKTYCRPSLEMIIQYWEKLFMKNGGSLEVNCITIPIIDRDPVIRIIIPYYVFAKMRVCLDLAYVMNRIWLKDWTNMNILLDEVTYDWNTLREATEYCIYVIESWVSIMMAVRKRPSRKFTEKSGYRTPITTITILFSAIYIISEYLKRVEGWAKNISSGNGPSETLESVDRTFYLRAFMTLKKVWNVLKSSKKSLKSHLEIPTKQHFKNLSDLDDANEISLVTTPEASKEQLSKLITKLNLSSRALYLGVRILGDSPVWPVVMVFARALQSRAIFNVDSEKHV